MKYKEIRQITLHLYLFDDCLFIPPINKTFSQIPPTSSCWY